jgi:hypothetical protein
MKWYTAFVLLLWLQSLHVTTLFAQTITSAGVLNFKCNGQIFMADSTHARGYALKQTETGFIKGANTENFVLSIEWKNMRGPGVYMLTGKEGKVEFTINHKTYLLKQTDDFIKVVISSIKQSGSFFLLKGTFEGQLQDKAGNKAKITDGRFETISL